MSGQQCNETVLLWEATARAVRASPPSFGLLEGTFTSLLAWHWVGTWEKEGFGVEIVSVSGL